MDINLLFAYGELKCGRVLHELPEKEIGSPKLYMEKVLRTITIPSLNRLFPVILKRVVNTSDLEPLGSDGGYTSWRIPPEIVGGLDIQGIKSCYPGNCGTSPQALGNFNSVANGYMGGTSYGAWPNRFGRFSSANLYETIATANLAYADLQALGSVQAAPTPRFKKPNILMINDAYRTTGVFTIEFCLNNDNNLISLDDNVYEGVRRLFILDLKASIYSEYSMWSSVETPMGSIDLKIDDWANAEAERDELYDNYDSLSHLRRHTIIAG